MFTATAIKKKHVYLLHLLVYANNIYPTFGGFRCMETKTSPLISQMLAFVGTLFIVTYNQDFFSFASN